MTNIFWIVNNWETEILVVRNLSWKFNVQIVPFRIFFPVQRDICKEEVKSV